MQLELKPHEALRILRRYLSVSQSQLAFQMGTTANSVARWESGKWPIGPTVLPHVRALVEQKLRDDIRTLMAEIKPELSMGEFEALLGHPTAHFFEDREGRIYIGSVIILVHHEHSLHISVDDGHWYAIGRDRRRRRVDKAFLSEIVKREKVRNQKGK